ATFVKSRLLLAAGEEDEARKLLEAAFDRADPEPKVLLALGKLYYEGKEYAKAVEIYELAHKAEPYDSKWLVGLLRVYTQTEDRGKQIETLKRLVPTDPDDLNLRVRLARLLLDEGQAAEAERYARQALEIDVLDAHAEQVLGDALVALGKVDGAVEAYQIILEQDERAFAARLGLARAYLLAGKKAEAGKEVARVLMDDPENEDAKRLQEMLDK